VSNLKLLGISGSLRKESYNTRLLQGPEVLVALARKEFDENGKLDNERYLKAIKTLMTDLRAEAERTQAR
jgi:NAD(P)H-dependent FMN reductase